MNKNTMNTMNELVKDFENAARVSRIILDHVGYETYSWGAGVVNASFQNSDTQENAIAETLNTLTSALKNAGIKNSPIKAMMKTVNRNSKVLKNSIL